MAEAEQSGTQSRAEKMNKRTTKTFAQNLKAGRERKNLSQHGLAKKTGLSVSYISMLERGMRTPANEVACLIAVATGQTFVDIYTPPAKPTVEQGNPQ
jgi:transcriptional regulator with XRE-family HTH domain